MAAICERCQEEPAFQELDGRQLCVDCCREVDLMHEDDRPDERQLCPDCRLPDGDVVEHVEDLESFEAGGAR